VGLTCTALLCITAGCSHARPDHAARVNRGYVYYLDGSGGGSFFMNWSRGVRRGLLDAGYDGAAEVFRWQTGWGIVSDQGSSEEYKRRKAAELARRIQQYSREHPGAPVTIIGLSAGTVVAVLALEQLPVACPVNNVVLLGCSISGDYRLTQGLHRVRNRLYVFTSQHDAVLAFLVWTSGTAAGLGGFRMPPGADAETRAQYAKITYVPWRPEFESTGNFGGHTDTVREAFVQEYIAPLVMQGGARRAQVQAAPAAGMVRNPDYEHWSGFPVGAWIAFDGRQLAGGQSRAVRVTTRLISKHEDRIVVERTYVLLAAQAEPARVQTAIVPAQVRPRDHPLTSPGAKVLMLPAERIAVAGKMLDCQGMSIQAYGQFPEWGSNVACRMYSNATVPGGVVKMSLKAYKEVEPFEFEGQLVAYGTAKSATPGT
jgi:pimeloyl-ACP methyl ester carboxylesterase